MDAVTASLGHFARGPVENISSNISRSTLAPTPVGNGKQSKPTLVATIKQTFVLRGSNSPREVSGLK